MGQRCGFGGEGGTKMWFGIRGREEDGVRRERGETDMWFWRSGWDGDMVWEERGMEMRSAWKE